MSSVPKPDRTTVRLTFALPSVPSGLHLRMKEIGRTVDDIAAAVAGVDAGRDEQFVGEDGDFVGLADAFGVFEDDDFIILVVARFELRIGFAARDPEAALGVEVHLDRLGEQRIGGVKIDLETFGEDEGLAFQLGIGIGYLGVALGVGE